MVRKKETKFCVILETVRMERSDILVTAMHSIDGGTLKTEYRKISNLK